MRISKEKIDKISEQILLLLYLRSPRLLFTSQIAKEIARDEEFTKKILNDLAKKDLITKIDKNSKGISYLKRNRWTLTQKVYDFYKNQ